MQQLTTKYGIPWTALMKISPPLDHDIVDFLVEEWNKIDWGENYCNYRRQKFQTAIYPDTRVFRVNRKTHVIATEKILDRIKSKIESIFDREMVFCHSELSLLVPRGKVPWHHDRQLTAHKSCRFMVPLSKDCNNIKYYFAGWNKQIPHNITSFDVRPYMNKEIFECTMDYGNCYFFNHRIPHSTASQSDKPRALFVFDLSPRGEPLSKNLEDFQPITVDECKELLPPIL